MEATNHRKLIGIKLVTLLYLLSDLLVVQVNGGVMTGSKIISPVLLIDKIEQLAKDTPLERWATDPEVVQKVDKVNSISRYTLTGDKTPLFERHNDDNITIRTCIVLSEEEDNIPLVNKGMKRIFVVLRHTQLVHTRGEGGSVSVTRKGPGDNYYVSLAFVRDAKEKDTNNVLTFNNVATKYVVEFGTFDEHVIPGRSSVTLHTLQCASSFLIPCAFNEKALSPPDKFIKSPPYKPKTISPAAIEDAEEKTSINVDLYADLDFKETEGRIFGAGGEDGVGIIGGLLSGIGGVVCGIVSIIASCADERAYGNTMPFGLAASTALAENPVWGGGKSYVGVNAAPPPGYPPPPGYYGRKRRETGPEITAHPDYPGWMTQFLAPKKGVTSKDKEVFYGVGNCPYVPKTSADFKNAASKAQLIDFYLTVLRTECNPWMKEMLEKIVDQGILAVNGKKLEFNPKNSLLNEPKLTLKELILLSAASEIDAFTSVYAEESNNPPKEGKSPDDKRVISQSTKFLISVGLKSLQRMIDETPLHFVHLSRHMLQNFKALFTKLNQDDQNLKRCSDDCAHDKEINLNDKIQVESMIRFIKRGLRADKKGSDVYSSYKEFYANNINIFEKIVKLYS